jgi:lambda family phage tail tape measure protein
MLQDRIGSVKSSLNPDIDPAKNEAARRAAAENNKSGATAGDGFLKGLKDRIEKAEQGEYAMLRLQAAEKGVSSAAGPLIDQLKQLDEAKSVSNYEDNLVRQNAEIEFQNSLIGRSAAEVAMLNIERKAELELAKQIEQIERAKGALSDESIAKMQAATEASIAIQKASISSRLEMERTWQTGATTSLQKYLDSAENIAKGTEDAFTRAFKGVEDAFVSLAMTGSLNFTNLTNSIIADIIRLQARAATAGLANFLTKSLTSMFSASLPDASGQHSVQGNADYVYDLHTGGIAGNGGSGRYLRDMRIFEDAPRYHSGGTIGLKPDEVPAILQRGERVLPRGAQIDNSVPVNIVVNNNGSSAQATAQDRGTDGFGTRQIEIMITDIVAKGMATGRLDTAMQSAFNIRRAGK